ncbi:hypothetical protein [Pantoea sp. GM01]|uniref:hypothetical protein n=1 Tax=Pantoea sp. GM01 TaxID=1144320 RepID=UPI000270FFE6|nr:hypothetical protein [Pantoea sp. GM01]EJL90251.1 hypothetical protein PMI17_01771 [Pantoea sp. GM01]
MTNKELVAAGHALAKAQGADAPLTEIAKLVSDLAIRLDVMTVCSDVLAAENVALKNYIDGECYIESKRIGVYTCAGINKPETPATDAILNAVRAEGVEMFAEQRAELSAKYSRNLDSMQAIQNDWAACHARLFAEQLRAGKDGE